MHNQIDRGPPPAKDLQWIGAALGVLAAVLDSYVLVKGMTPFLNKHFHHATFQALAAVPVNETAIKTVIFGAFPMAITTMVTSFFAPRVSIISGFLALMLALVCATATAFF